MTEVVMFALQSGEHGQRLIDLQTRRLVVGTLLLLCGLALFYRAKEGRYGGKMVGIALTFTGSWLMFT